MDNEKELTHIDLFSGIGGFTLAAEWAGFRTVVFCEKEEFCQKVLKKHWPEIPITEEIRDFDGTKYRGATLLTGGFPCQPFSVAGQRRGKEDDRYLWPEMLRVIIEAKPDWILAENVPGIFRMALDTVLADLEGEGYTVGTFIIPACGLNAPHRRNRIWIVGYSTSSRRWGATRRIQERKNTITNGTYDHASDSRKQERNWLSSIGKQEMAKIGRKNQDAQNTIGARTRNQSGKIDNQGRRVSQNRREGIRQKDGKISTGGSAPTDKYAPDSKGRRCEWGRQEQMGKGRKMADGIEGTNSNASNSDRFNGNNAGFDSSKISQQKKTEIQGDWQENWYEVAARFCRVDDGVSDRIHRLKALGNAIVPQIAYEILKNIAWIEKQNKLTKSLT